MVAFAHELGLGWPRGEMHDGHVVPEDRKSTRLNSSHSQISYAVFCLKKKKQQNNSVSSYVIEFYSPVVVTSLLSSTLSPTTFSSELLLEQLRCLSVISLVATHSPCV